MALAAAAVRADQAVLSDQTWPGRIPTRRVKTPRLLSVSGIKLPKSPKSPSKLLTALNRRGPHRVMRGDLRIAGMSGVLYTPAEGEKIPAVAFGHGWLADSRQYKRLLMHFASWGFAVIAPDAERGPLASDAALAAELRSALSIIAHTPLGTGEVTIDPEKLGLVGHGFGASAAILAAAQQQLLGQPAVDVAGVVALYPAPTTPSLLPAARNADAPGLIVASSDVDTMSDNALPIATAYGSDAAEKAKNRPDVVLRTLPGKPASSLLERRSLKGLVGFNGADGKAHGWVKALATGFLLDTVAGESGYGAVADPGKSFGKTGVIDLADPPERQLDHLSQLIGAKPGKKSPPAPVR